MRNRWRKAWLGALAGLVLAGPFASTSFAKVVAKRDADGRMVSAEQRGGALVKTSDGIGWRASGAGNSDESMGNIVVDLVKAGLNPKEGAIDFIVTRSEEEASEPLFTLYDKSGATLFVMEIFWKGTLCNSDPQLGTDEFWQTHNTTPCSYPNRWIPRVPLDVNPGQTFRLTITWGGGGAKDAIYVDGRKMATKGADGASFGKLLEKSVTMEIGEERSYDRYAHMMSVLKDFRILDIATVERVADDTALAVASVSHNASLVAGYSGKLVAGDTVGVTLEGTPGAVGTFDIVHYPDVSSTIDIDWRGWGVYLEEKTFFEEGEVNLRDVDGYEVFAALTPFDYAAPGMEPLAKLKVGEQQYAITAPEVDKPYYVAVVALMRDGTRKAVIAPIMQQPMTENEPGIYTGSYKVGWKDRYSRAAAIGRLTSGSTSDVQTASATFSMDPSLTLAVATEPSELRADEKSVAKVTVVVTDVNGNPVPEHEVKFMLFTTSQYTGVVGGGAFAEQVGGTVKEMSFGKTDLFGTVTATYVAGFAAKTAIIVARDMLSNNTGSGWVKTYITATAQLELMPLSSVAADSGYEISVISSDEWLTADGKSTAKITARVTRNGLPIEGHTVGFGVSSGTGTVRVVKDTTDRDGVARAVYTAGKKIGMVLITATDQTVGISGSVQIELRSDAPAKIAIKLTPEKLPADGRSRAELHVLVTDINDNPNDGVEVEYALVEGSGDLRADKGLTDRRGEAETVYVAGKTPGVVSIEITVRSTVPTPEEIAKVNETALAVTDYDFF